MAISGFSPDGFTVLLDDTVSLSLSNLLLKEKLTSDEIEITAVNTVSKSQYQVLVALDTAVDYQLQIQKPRYYFGTANIVNDVLTATGAASSASVDIYPTLSPSQLNITLAQPGTFRITNGLGVQVMSGYIPAGTSTLTISDLKSGVYSISIADGQSSGTQARFIKQ